MISLMLTTGNERESQILKMAFSQRGIDVVLFKPNYQNFVKMLQFLPDLIILEFPRICSDELHFVKLLRSHRKTKKTPILGYGNKVEMGIKNGYLAKGVNIYIERPLKFSVLLAVLDKNLKQINKSLDSISGGLTKSDREADMALVMNPETLPLKKIEIMTSYVSRFLAFPFTVSKVLALAEGKKSGAGDLAKVIETDPVLAANILKVSNTVFFASANRRISSIKDAIVRIGFSETRRIVMSISVMELFDKKLHTYGFDRMDFWYHSLATAVISERMARRLGSLSCEEAFLAGLVHDFGIVILDEFFPDLLSQSLEKTAEDGGLFITHETSILGIHHNDIVEELFEKWKMPQTITRAVIDQYRFSELSDVQKNPDSALAAIVGIANVMAKALMLGKECDQFVLPCSNGFFHSVNMPAGINDTFIQEIEHDILMYRQFLGLDERPVGAGDDGISNPENYPLAFIDHSAQIFNPALQYLLRQGVPCTKFSSDVQTSELDNTFSCICVWSDGSLDPQRLTEYTQCVPAGTDPDTLTEPPPMPVLVFVPDQSAIVSSVKDLSLSFMPQCFDLRSVDQALLDMSDGKTISYRACSFTSKDLHSHTADSETQTTAQDDSSESTLSELPTSESEEEKQQDSIPEKTVS